jgi:hypothetical protein
MIQLIKPTYIRGALADAGTSHSLGTGQEAALVHAGIAAYVVAPSNEPNLVARYRLDSARKIIALQDPDGDDYRGWDDLRFPAQAINPTGPEVAPTVATSGILGTLLFPTNATAVIAGIAQHAGAAAHPLGQDQQRLGRRGLAIPLRRGQLRQGAARLPAWESASATIPDVDTAELHLISSWSDIGLSTDKESCLIAWQIRRKHDDAGDTYASDARLFEFDIHYQVGKLGTIDEIPS